MSEELHTFEEAKRELADSFKEAIEDGDDRDKRDILHEVINCSHLTFVCHIAMHIVYTMPYDVREQAYDASMGAGGDFWKDKDFSTLICNMSFWGLYEELLYLTHEETA